MLRAGAHHSVHSVHVAPDVQAPHQSLQRAGTPHRQVLIVMYTGEPKACISAFRCFARKGVLPGLLGLHSAAAPKLGALMHALTWPPLGAMKPSSMLREARGRGSPASGESQREAAHRQAATHL